MLALDCLVCIKKNMFKNKAYLKYEFEFQKIGISYSFYSFNIIYILRPLS